MSDAPNAPPPLLVEDVGNLSLAGECAAELGADGHLKMNVHYLPFRLTIREPALMEYLHWRHENAGTASTRHLSEAIARDVMDATQALRVDVYVARRHEQHGGHTRGHTRLEHPRNDGTHSIPQIDVDA